MSPSPLRCGRAALSAVAFLLLLVPLHPVEVMANSESLTLSLAQGVQRRVLDNGLTVLLKPQPGSGSVAIVTWVKAGYFHEDDPVAGISHVIEHMYFNGTPTRPDPEAISRQTKGIGGELNAGTIYDHTSYYVIVPAARFAEALEVQADAFQNPLFDAGVLEKEMQAILQEARRKLDDPSAFGREKMFAMAFQKHRMRRWRIGQEEGLRTLTREQLVRYYEDHYRPANTVLAVVGDVDSDEAFGQIQRLYGGQPRGQLRKHTGPSEGAQREFRYQRLTGDVSRNYMFLGFHTPGQRHRDVPALEVLATILGAGTSSRLNLALKEKLGVVTSISASSFQFEDVGMLEIDAIADMRDLDRAAREIFVEIERVKQFGVTDDELARARTLMATARGFSLEEVLGQASTLAHYEAMGDYRLADQEMADLEAVTSADVQRVARSYLQLSNASLLEYCGAEAPEGRPAADMSAHLHGAVLAAAAVMDPAAPAAAAPSYLDRAQLAQWSQRAAAPPRTGSGVQRFQLPKGAVLVVREDHRAPTVSMGAYFRGGRIDESQNTSGRLRLMQRMMTKQTQTRSVEQLARETEALGSSIGRVATDDWFGFTMGTLGANAPYALDILFDVLANPRFSRDQLDREKEAHLMAIRGVEDQSSSYAHQLLREALFGEHPYGLPELGSARVLQYMLMDRLEAAHVDAVRPEALVLAVAGDVDPQLIREMAAAYLERWTVGGEPLPGAASDFYKADRFLAMEPLTDSRQKEASRDRSQTAMMVAFRTVPEGHPDSYALDVLQSITGGMGGSFFEQIRTKRGLAYQVSTFSSTRAMAGYFGCYVACTPDSAQAVQQLVLDLFGRLKTNPPSQQDVERAVQYVTGTYRTGLQTSRAQAAQLAVLELLGRPLSEYDDYPRRVAATTRDDLARVAAAYFDGAPHAAGIVAGTLGSAATPPPQ